ncbi:MAG: hypothetical protein AAF587_33190 [Bacteroidota bacterium]
MTDESTSPDTIQDENQELQKIFPLFKSWKALYLFVLAELGILIVLFYLFSQAYA